MIANIKAVATANTLPISSIKLCLNILWLTLSLSRVLPIKLPTARDSAPTWYIYHYPAHKPPPVLPNAIACTKGGLIVGFYGRRYRACMTDYSSCWKLLIIKVLSIVHFSSALYNWLLIDYPVLSWVSHGGGSLWSKHNIIILQTLSLNWVRT